MATLARVDTLSWRFATAGAGTRVTLAVDLEPLGPGLDILGEPLPGEGPPPAPVLLQRLHDLMSAAA
jgi:hypothetical protein